MKRLLPLLLLLCATPAHATWTLVQVKDNTASCNASCPVTVTATAAGNLLVAGVIAANTGITISSVSGGCAGTWTRAASTAVSGAGDGSSELFYCLNSSAAATTVTLTLSGSPNGLGVVWEAHSTNGSIAVDSGATPSGTKTDTSCTSCAGTALTLSGNNDFIAALAPCGSSCTGLTGTGWTNDLANASGDGIGHGITTGSLTAPATWTQSPAGTLVSNAAAFQEGSGGAVACNNKIALMGAGCK
jgi:hypothetical protein